MKFLLGPPPDSLSVDELASGEWRRLDVLPLWALQLTAIPVGIVVATALFACWVITTPDFEIAFAGSELTVPVILATLLMGTLLQFGAHSPAGFYRHSTLGFWPSRFALYTYSGKLSKTRYLLVRGLPFVVMALGPLLFVVISGRQSGWLVFVSLLTALTFGMNAVLALIELWRMPANAQVGGIGLQAYWRKST